MSRDWKNIFPSRRNMFMIGGGIAWLGLTARLAELQIFRAAEFDSKAQANRIRLEPSPAHRGTIYDRTGRILAGSKRNFYVTLRPELIGDSIAIADVIDKLGKVLSLSESKKKSILQDATSQAGFVDVSVADDLTWEEFAQINVMAPELAGVSAEVGELRSYPLQSAFYHTVGYVAKASEADIMRISEDEVKAAGETPDTPAGKARISAVKRLYKHPAMRLGKQGIEAFDETQLKGIPGRQRVLVNAAGRVIDRLPSDDIAGTPGTETVLSLDAELQNYAIQRFGNESGSAIVIDIATGEVLVMMTTPAPDPNLFVSGIAPAPYNALKADERNPLYHKAYDGVYPPGSTFKIVVAAAALESGAMKPEDTVHCSGSQYYYDRVYHCYKPEGHGTMDLHNGIKNSCDCYFYEAARRTGIEKIAEVAKQFGLMHRYELGLTGGKIGVAPNDEWKRANTRTKEAWRPGDTISAGIGQGYVLATPFEMAVMASRIAGGHAVPNPHLVDSGAQAPDLTIQPLGNISEKTLELVRAGMRAVCSPEEHGTAWRFGIVDEKNELPAPYTGVRMGGKSGSAQVRVIDLAERDSHGKAIANSELPWKMRDHAHFVAFAPVDKPRYSCAITVEHGSSGSNTAAPIARDILFQVLKADPGARKPFQPQKKEVATAGAKAKPT
jgi:penicillin-binding protein 2